MNGHDHHLASPKQKAEKKKEEEEEEEEEEESVKISEMELTKIRQMRAILETQDPSVKEVDDAMIRRFLRARDLEVEKASCMLQKYLRWKGSFVPTGSVSASQIQSQIEHNKVFLQGSDKKGRPIVLVLANKHYQAKNLDEFKRFVVYVLDKTCSRLPPGQEKFVGIGDLKGWGYCNSDIRGYIAALSILQDYYPERLGKLLIVNAPYIFMRVWKIVYPFIDKNTRKKIVFVENKNLTSTLMEDIDESQIPKMYGGKQPLIPIHES